MLRHHNDRVGMAKLDAVYCAGVSTENSERPVLHLPQVEDEHLGGFAGCAYG